MSELDNEMDSAATPATDFDFDVWLATGTINEAVVPIYMDQQAITELEELGELIDQLTPDGPATIDQPDVPADLQQRWDAAMARYEASRSDWTLVPIERDTVREIWELLPNPAPPENPAKARWPIGKNGPDRQRIIEQRTAAEADFQKKLQEWKLEMDRAEANRVLMFLAASISRVTTREGTKYGVTVDQLRALRDKPYGVPRINRLWNAYERVMGESVEPSRPTLPGASGSDRA